MKVNKKFRLQYSLQNSFFLILFLSLVFVIGVISKQYVYVKDMTQANRSVLTKGSVEVLESMKNPIQLTIFASNDDGSENFRKSIVDFFAKYQRAKSDLNIKFINPIEEPKLLQELGIRSDGEVVVEYNKRTEHISPPFAEQEFTNLLVRLSRTNQKPIMYLDGHGEKNLIGKKTNDLGGFGEQLRSKGFKLSNPDLTVLSEVPKEGAMLVIASPLVNIGKIEAKKILNFVEKGGNLLWLLQDNDFKGLDDLAKYLSLKVSEESVFDPLSEKYGGDKNTTYASIYGEHPITRNFMLRTIYSNAHEVNAQDSYENGWEVSELIETATGGWLPLNKKNNEDKFNFIKGKDKEGPINIGIALKRKYGDKGQRVVVIGNSSFLSNTFITSGGNLDLGINIISWLAGDDQIITIQPMPLKDINVSIPNDSKGVYINWIIFHTFEIFIPVGLFILGFVIWSRRRKA